MPSSKRILLIITGGIAAYKCLELIRRLRDQGYRVRVVMTETAHQFVTPLSVAALTNERVFTNLFDLDDEREIGHIRLARDTDAVVVAPASADFIARMANGLADDLASAVLLATDAPVLVAPAMNPYMWRHPATRRNVEQLKTDGITFVGPAIGEMAESNEAGMGRLAEVPQLINAIESVLEGQSPKSGILSGKHVLITAGPTHEPIDPVRYIANRSSGKQGYALAEAARQLGADVTLVSGPVNLQPPADVNVKRVMTATEMLDAVRSSLPADIAIFAAAVADWRVAQQSESKIKKTSGNETPKLSLTENPDILATIAGNTQNRPSLVIGFAAETTDVLTHASKKRTTKSADWIVANDVSPETGIMGGDSNRVHVIMNDKVESWPEMSKIEVARQLLERAAITINGSRAVAE